MLFGLALAAIPLAVAVLNAAVQMRKLANTSQELVLRGVEATRSSQQLLSSIAALERTARLYQILGDNKLLDAYSQTDERLTATRQQLALQLAGSDASPLLASVQRLQQSLRQGMVETPPGTADAELIDAMHDGVVFVDSQARILRWNAGAERLTGVTERAALGRAFVPCLLDFCASDGRRLEDEECPIRRALESSGQVRQRVLLLGRNTSHVAVDLHVAPVLNSDGSLQGATVLLYDAQPEVSLEERCEALHEEATKDPLTKVANRAEFDRMQALFIEAHQQAGLPCSLIMTDIDHFKSINDTFGHQAGDDAIITVANLLRSMCRAGDLVARYGGEEFAVLCADCSNADAARRADEIRAQLASMSHQRLSGRQITASFGVTEYQPGTVSPIPSSR